MKDLRVAVGVVGVAAAVLSIAAWRSDSATSSAGPLSSGHDGADLFLRKGCASCHTGPQSTARVDVAPSLAHAADWAGERRPGFTAGDYVHESIVNPGVFISPEFTRSGPVAMPSLNLTEAEVDAIVAYLLGLSSP